MPMLKCIYPFIVPIYKNREFVGTYVVEADTLWRCSEIGFKSEYSYVELKGLIGDPGKSIAITPKQRRHFMRESSIIVNKPDKTTTVEDIPDMWVCKPGNTLFGNEDIINCPSCGEFIYAKDARLSYKYTDSSGIGYLVCKDCKDDEMQEGL